MLTGSQKPGGDNDTFNCKQFYYANDVCFYFQVTSR